MPVQLVDVLNCVAGALFLLYCLPSQDAKLMKSDHVFPLFVPAVVASSYVSSQVEEVLSAYKGDELFFAVIIPFVICYMDKRCNDFIVPPVRQFKLRIELPGSSTSPADIKIYIDTAIVVLLSYVSLLEINWSYIWLAIFPFMALVFIGALCNKLSHQSGSQRRDNGEANNSRGSRTGTGNDETTTKEPEGLKATAVIPYWVLCSIGQFRRDDSLIVSQFLLFLSSMLGALTLMMMRLPAGVSPGVAPASELLHKTSLVVLLVTVHTMAAELLGEDVVLFCLPELVPVLLWFSVHLDRGSSVISIDNINSYVHTSWLIILGAVVAPAFAYLASTMDESAGLLIYHVGTKTLVSCGVSGLLIYYVVFMLRQWPGQADTATATLKEAVQLLQFWANVWLVAAAVSLVFTSLAAVRLGLHGPKVAALAKFFNDYVPRLSN